MRFPISLRKLAVLNFLAAAVFGALALRASAAEAMTLQAITAPFSSGALVRLSATAPGAPSASAAAN